MGYTKKQFVEAALEELGITNYVFDVSSRSTQSALRRLDAMMQEWNARSIRIGYFTPVTPEESEISAESGVPDAANEAIILNLAIRIAPSYGKTVSFETKSSARRAFTALQAFAATVPERYVAPGMPTGAGHKGRDYCTFFPGPNLEEPPTVY